MKKILLPSIVLLFASCGGGSGSSAVQTDTVRSEKLISHVPADSIIQNGEYIKYYKNGVVQMRGMMKDGKRDGLWKSFYQNGNPWSQTTFKGGIKEGPTTTWYDNNNKRYDGNYKNDQESGKWTYYDEKGNISGEQTYP